MCLRERPNIFLRNKQGFFYSMHHQNNIFCSFSFRPKQHYIHHMLNALFYNKILNYKDNIIKVILNLCLNIVCTLIFIKNCLNFFLLFVILVSFTLWASAISLHHYITLFICISLISSLSEYYFFLIWNILGTSKWVQERRIE